MTSVNIKESNKNDKFLLEQHIKRLKKASNNSRIPEAIANSNIVKKYDYYNCWGFTAYILGWFNRLLWLDDYIIEYCLEKFTYEISENNIKVGDIIVYRDAYENNLIEHTAIISDISNGIIVHKPGNLPVELSYFDTEYYGYCDITYRRPYKNRKFKYADYKKSFWREFELDLMDSYNRFY